MRSVPLGAARVRDRWPTDDVEWIREELARVGEVAGLFRRGDALLAEPIPDVTRAVARLRIEGSVLEGVELAGLQRLLVASRLVHADLRRVAEVAPLASALARPLPDKSHRAAAGAVGGSRREPAGHRQSPAGRRPARGAGRTTAPPSPARRAAAGSRLERRSVGRVGHHARRALRDSGAARFPQPAGRNHP